MTHSYRKITGSKAKTFISRINAGWGGSPFDDTRTALHARDLSFLQGWCLVEASDATSLPEKKCIALDDGTEAVAIDYNENFIHDFCKARNLRIDRHMASDYLKFWLEYTRIGPERFILVESIDELPWREDPSPVARKYLSATISPLSLQEATPSHFVYKGYILFRDSLFECKFEIGYTGVIRIAERNLLAEELAIIDTFTGF